MSGYEDAVQSQIESLSAGRAAVRVATLTLTSAQLLALNATPVQILPPPGPGKTYAIHNSLAFSHFGGMAYAAGPSNMTLNFAVGSSVWLISQLALLTTGADGFTQGQSVLGNLMTALQVNAAMVLRAGAAITVGNGTLTVFLFYSVIDATLLQ